MPRTPSVLRSPVEFPCSSLGSLARSSPVQSCWTLFSPRDPVDALDRIFFASAPWVRCNLASWPGASCVMITCGPEDQESGQSSQSGRWSPGQDSLLVNRVFSWIAKNKYPTLHHWCSLLFGTEGALDVLSPRTRTLKYQPWSSSDQPRKLPCSSLRQGVRSSPLHLLGFGVLDNSFRRNSVLGLPGILDFHAPGILSAMTQRSWYNLTPRRASQNNRALDKRVFWAS